MIVFRDKVYTMYIICMHISNMVIFVSTFVISFRNYGRDKFAVTSASLFTRYFSKGKFITRVSLLK